MGCHCVKLLHEIAAVSELAIDRLGLSSIRGEWSEAAFHMVAALCWLD
jgi:hypothetical protein